METIYNRHRQRARAPLGLRIMQGPSAVAEASQVSLFKLSVVKVLLARLLLQQHSALLQDALQAGVLCSNPSLNRCGAECKLGP